MSIFEMQDLCETRPSAAKRFFHLCLAEHGGEAVARVDYGEYWLWCGDNAEASLDEEEFVAEKVCFVRDVLPIVDKISAIRLLCTFVLWFYSASDCTYERYCSLVAKTVALMHCPALPFVNGFTAFRDNAWSSY